MPDAAAIERATGLLRTVLPDTLLAELDTEGLLTVRGSAGGVYEIRMGRAGNIVRLGEDGKPEERLCIHPAMDVPDPDTVLAQVLMLWTDEPLFQRLANRTNLRGPVRDDPTQVRLGSLREFLQAISTRRAEGHRLVPHDDPFRLRRGFTDRTTGEWVVIELNLLRNANAEDIGVHPAVLAELRSEDGMNRLLGHDPAQERLELISSSLTTSRGRRALGHALLGRIRYGGPMTPDARASLCDIGFQIRAIDPEPAEDLRDLYTWLNEQSA